MFTMRFNYFECEDFDYKDVVRAEYELPSGRVEVIGHKLVMHSFPFDYDITVYTADNKHHLISHEGLDGIEVTES